MKLREQFEGILEQEKKQAMLDLLRSIPVEERPVVDYPRGVKEDAWHYGWDDGYNQKCQELKQWVDEKMKELG